MLQVPQTQKSQLVNMKTIKADNMNGRWKKYLTEAIVMHARGKQLEKSLQFKKVFRDDLPPSILVEKMMLAESVKKLYSKAHRMCSILKTNLTPAEASENNLEYLYHTINNDLSRINEVIVVLNNKGKRWGLDNKDNKEEESPATHRDPFAKNQPLPPSSKPIVFAPEEQGPPTVRSPSFDTKFDSNEIDDGFAEELKGSLLSINDLIKKLLHKLDF